MKTFKKMGTTLGLLGALALGYINPSYAQEKSNSTERLEQLSNKMDNRKSDDLPVNEVKEFIDIYSDACRGEAIDNTGISLKEFKKQFKNENKTAENEFYKRVYNCDNINLLNDLLQKKARLNDLEETIEDYKENGEFIKAADLTCIKVSYKVIKLLGLVNAYDRIGKKKEKKEGESDSIDFMGLVDVGGRGIGCYFDLLNASHLYKKEYDIESAKIINEYLFGWGKK